MEKDEKKKRIKREKKKLKQLKQGRKPLRRSRRNRTQEPTDMELKIQRNSQDGLVIPDAGIKGRGVFTTKSPPSAKENMSTLLKLKICQHVNSVGYERHRW